MRDEHSIVSFDDESLILVDPNDVVLGYLPKKEAHDGEGRLHRAFSVFLFDAEGQLLLQQRSAEKRLWPLYWANTCCSHPRRGEDLLSAAKRRLQDELGLEVERLRFVYRFVYHAQFKDLGSEHELCSVLIGSVTTPPKPNRHEIESTRFVDPADLDEMLVRDPEIYTPWLKMEWKALREEHWELLRTYVGIA